MKPMRQKRQKKSQWPTEVSNSSTTVAEGVIEQAIAEELEEPLIKNEEIKIAKEKPHQSSVVQEEVTCIRKPDEAPTNAMTNQPREESESVSKEQKHIHPESEHSEEKEHSEQSKRLEFLPPDKLRQ